MAQQIIDTTTNNGSYIGDPAKTAFTKVNANFTELYNTTANNVLLKSGGVMTGLLTTNNGINSLSVGATNTTLEGGTGQNFGLMVNSANNASASCGISFQRSGQYALNFGLWAGNNRFCYGGWSGGNVVTTLFDSSHSNTPNSDNAYSLGSSSLRFAIVYSVAGVSTSSDSRIKNLIGQSDLGLDFIKALNPVSYTLKEGQLVVTEEATGEFSETEVDGEVVKTPLFKQVETPKEGTRHHYGLFAQEVAQALTSAGKDPSQTALWMLDDPTDANSRQALRYAEFIAPLIKAVQELSAKVDAQATQIAALKAAPGGEVQAAVPAP